jgi:hypothetical protein
VAEGARLESVFRLTPNEGSNPSLSARLNEKAPDESPGLFHLLVEKEDMMRTLWFDKFAGSEFGRALARPAGPAPWMVLAIPLSEPVWFAPLVCQTHHSDQYQLVTL